MALNSGSGGGGSGAIRAGRAFVELYTRNNLAAGLNAAAADLKAFGSKISSIGLKFAGLGAAGAAGLIPISNTLNDIAKQGKIADAIGLTSEQFTGIAGVAKSVGNDTKEFIESLVTLGKLGTDAAAGTEQASQAFAAMGLNAQEFIKLKADEQFYAIFDALGKMKDPLQRTRALMLAFGEDGGKILLPLLGKSGDELRKMAAGFAISSDDMASATKASTAYATATQTLSKAWQAVSIAAAPIVKILADGLSAAVAPVTEFVKQNREMVVGLGLAVGGVAALGVGMFAVGTAVSALGASWAALIAVERRK
jgi:phage-related minor tail protein